jgi:predicted CoA-binding protein
MTDNLVTEIDDVREILKTHKRVAVLGIKPESRSEAAAFYVAEYLAKHGYEIIPVPVYYPEVTEILGRPVIRDLTAIDGEVDIVDVFRRPDDIDQHVDDMIRLSPKVVWFQLGIRNDDAAKRLADAGIRVIQDRCMLADHRRLLSTST